MIITMFWWFLSEFEGLDSRSRCLTNFFYYYSFDLVSLKIAYCLPNWINFEPFRDTNITACATNCIATAITASNAFTTILASLLLKILRGTNPTIATEEAKWKADTLAMSKPDTITTPQGLTHRIIIRTV